MTPPVLMKRGGRIGCTSFDVDVALWNNEKKKHSGHEHVNNVSGDRSVVWTLLEPTRHQQNKHRGAGWTFNCVELK